MAEAALYNGVSRPSPWDVIHGCFNASREKGGESRRLHQQLLYMDKKGGCFNASAEIDD